MSKEVNVISTELLNLINNVPNWNAAEAQVTELTGGLTNQIYLVEINSKKYVLRRLSSNTDHLGIDRDCEAEATQIAADLGIGPHVYYFSKEQGILVVDFVESQPLKEEDFLVPERLERIVQTIKKYHSGPSIPASFCPFKTVRAYHDLALENGVKLPPEVEPALALALKMDSELSSVRTCCPCHNDLLAGNFLDDGQSIWVIDWEYAGMGDPFFDLGNFSVNQKLNAEDKRRLLTLYFGEYRESDSTHLEYMTLASDLREAFWGFLQSGVSEMDIDYYGYGKEHLDRFLANSSRLTP